MPRGGSDLLGGEQVPLEVLWGSSSWCRMIIYCSVSPVLGELDFCPQLICRGKLMMFV